MGWWRKRHREWICCCRTPHGAIRRACPPRPDGDASQQYEDTAYADWLLRIYRRWTRHGLPMPIRLFDSLLSAARGGPSFTEALGTDPADLLIIDTDGSWAQPDSMKTVRDRADATGMRVTEHTVDEVARHPQIAARQGGLAALCAACRACPVVRICGGGLYAHRYGPGGFDNPSVYCADLKELITKITADERVAPVRTHALTAGGFTAFAAGPAIRPPCARSTSSGCLGPWPWLPR